MTMNDKKSDDSGTQITDGTELNDAELGKITGGRDPTHNEMIKMLTGFSISGNATILNQVGNAMGVAGGATKPKPA